VKKFLLVCLAALLFSASPAFAKFDPAFTWTTLETQHFLIHYHQAGEEIAKRAAQIAEDVHARLTPRIQWEPKEKTHLVLVDAMDEANGMASPIPYNQIILLLTQPVGEPGFGTTPYDDWLRLVITHEYTHVLQLDMAKGGYGRVMRALFGRSPLSFPNVFQPEWMIEGLAVYEETEQTSGGRGRSAGADMVLRMATLENRFPSISKMTVFPDTWPSGQVPYLFGASFTRFIAQKYGREKLADLSANYSKRGFPFLVESTGKKTLRNTYGNLYYEWKNSLREQYEKQQKDVAAKGLTLSNPLTRKGYQTLSPAYSPDGAHIAYLEANGDEFPGIYVMNADGTGDRKIVEDVFPSSASGITASWAPDGNRLYYTKAEIIRNTDFYDDIYFYDFQKRAEVRVTEGLRARDPDVSPDGRKLVFVTNRMGMTRLAGIDLSAVKGPAREKHVTFMTEESRLQYETPRWSPDGSKIAVGVWQPGGYKDIWILDAEGRKLQEVSHDRVIEGSPSWSPDGAFLYFASDRTGIYNLYALELETGKVYQMTNVLGGAFSPSPSRDNKNLVFTSYSSKGYDVHTLPVDRAAWQPAGPAKDAYPIIAYEERTVETSTRPYSAWSTIAPRFWLPWFGYSSESGTLGGFMTLGQDVVQRHSYLITGLYGPKNHRTWYSLDYFYEGLYPTVYLHASDQDATFSDLLQDNIGSEDYVERQKNYSLEFIIPVTKTRKQQAITIGYRWKEVSELTKVVPLSEPWPGYSGPVPFEGVLASGRLSYIFNNARQYDFSISPEQGRTIEAGYERLDTSIGSDLELNKYTLDWHEYVNFPWPHHVLQVRAFGGASTGQKFPQGAFQLGGDMPGDITLSIDDREVYLRGYPLNQFRGQNAALASLEYRFPIVNIEDGSGQMPVFFRRLHGAVFAEAGNAWDEGAFHGEDAKRSVGAEARFDMDLAYGLIPVTLRLVVAKGLDEFGELQTYLSFWMPLGL
jgi:Tol biopolymer transport system component